MIAGWGAFNFNEKSSDILQEARVNTISNLECNNSNWVNEAIETKILDSKICAESPGKDACLGRDRWYAETVSSELDMHGLCHKDSNIAKQGS